MTFYSLLLFAAILSAPQLTHGQTDQSGLQAVIPDSLVDCYRNSTLLTRENLPPMTLNTLLAIIRKLETLPGTFLDMRTLSTQIMTSYRLDGIERNPDIAPSPYVVPYGPSGNQFYRYKILMDGLIPSSGNTFPDTALRTEEKCALHLMLSSSVDRNERGDESVTCNQLTNYVRPNYVRPNVWNSRIPRDTRTYQEEVEILAGHHKEQQMSSRWLGGAYNGLSCPLETGVVKTRFGAVKFGLIVGGIAAGLQSQSVSRRNLILVAKANSLRGTNYKFPRLYGVSDNNPNISNIWAATLSGEIGEVALLQGPLSSSQMRIGLNGGWNDSVLPRYYFLQEDNKDALTDTDIRGAVDGLMLGVNAQSWNSLVGGGGRLKLSQLIDMFYSERGVLNTNIRACQRVSLFQSMFSVDDIMQQSFAFSGVLELELPSAVNVDNTGLQNFNSAAVQKFTTYFSSMVDNQCSFGSTSYTGGQSPGTVSNIVSPAVHLYLVIDYTYDYLDAIRIASQLAEKLEVSRFTGNISIINAKDASVAVNSTNDVLQMYANFTRNNYYMSSQRGFDLARIVRDVGDMLRLRLDWDKQLNTPGGPASVVLIVPSTSATVNDNDKNYIYNRLADLRNSVPDARWMFLNPGSKDKFASYVQDSSKDILTLTLTDIPTSVDAVVARLKQVPRRLINPTCMSFYGSGTSTSNLVLRTYIEPVGGVQYYRIHPNYFYGTSSGTIRISSSTGRTLNICQSRVNVLPGNNSQSDICRQITSDAYQITINGACSGTNIAGCSPIYFSVAVVPTTSSAINSCTDDNCRYPDNIQVDIRQDGLTCASGVSGLIGGSTLVMVLLAILTNHLT
ncbi:uncharacterized protein LOC128989676 [Macrosteles quadrilineatus]|uniref:uncharacterized protein LOC128989676 n=1 Tax=Macrosteles quadrilineatus TaxID=74068 RepID=UPI0023E19CE1|nr:uncharacterized protein LOC128989676 [Macrosteles quadrilineatus]